ncbi:recombinase family protein [Roseovarius mucosus]|uniref:recombinase family protein n=1 Tax=Roseovarius mucosus TaxID=215743 RepID=UPI003BAA8954
MATYIYTRVSTFDQVEGTSLDEQDRKCRGVAMMQGWDVEEVFSDPGITGSKPLSERPAGRKMTTLLTQGDTVIAAKIDRLFRSSADALSTVEAWKKAGIDLVIAEFGADPVTENGTSKLLFGILSMVAEFERSLIRERLEGGKAAKRAKGGHAGGKTPFGYDKVGEGRDAMLVKNEGEQAAIALIKELRAEGASLRATALAVEERLGLKVSHMVVRRIDAD